MHRSTFCTFQKVIFFIEHFLYQAILRFIYYGIKSLVGFFLLREWICIERFFKKTRKN
jgi:hypothetical protein